MNCITPSLSFSNSTPLTRQSSGYSLHIEDIQSPLLDAAIRNVDTVLSSQTKALKVLTMQYRNSSKSINQLKTSLRYLNNSLNSGGKIIVSGMGKSYKIASKTVATMNSLKIHSALLHPSEALHGDLGMIREDHNDSLIIISASGNSPELLQMLEHIPLSVPIILMTCTRDSVLGRHPKVVSLILAEIPSVLSESNIYGLTAPTISTTLCLTLLDAVSIALSELYISDLKVRKEVFAVNHPGGAIGINNKLEKLSLLQALTNGDPAHDKSSTANLSDLTKAADPAAADPAAAASNGAKNTRESSASVIEQEAAEGDDGSVESGTDAGLHLSELVLAKNVADSKFKTVVSKLPETETEMLRLLTLNDYIIVTGPEETSILECQMGRDIVREFQDQEWSEIAWKLCASLVPYSL